MKDAKAWDEVHFTPFLSAGFCSLSGIQTNAVSEKVISAASSGAKIPSPTSCCMISRACCSREELLPVTGSDCEADGCFSFLSIVL